MASFLKTFVTFLSKSNETWRVPVQHGNIEESELNLHRTQQLTPTYKTVLPERTEG